MDAKDNKIRITLTEEQLTYLAHIMDHFTDYMAHDDRPDHGLGILKQYRDINDETKHIIFMAAGKLLRLRRKLSDKRYKEKTAM